MGRIAAAAILALPYFLRVHPEPGLAHAISISTSAGAQVVDGLVGLGFHPGWRRSLDAGTFERIAGACVRGEGREIAAREDAARIVLLVTLEAMRSDRIGRLAEGRSLTPMVDRFLARSIWTKEGVAACNASHDSLRMILAGRYIPMDEYAVDRAVGDACRSMDAASVAFFPDGKLVSHRDLFGCFDEIHRGTQRGEDILPVLAEVLARHVDRRLFLWVHLPDPHAPYDPMPKDRLFGEDDVGLYEAEIVAMDRAFGAVLEAVEKAVGRNGVVVGVTGDHGEAFGEHGVFTHKSGLHEEQVRVPWAVCGPGLPPRLLEHPAGHVDLLPSIFSLAGWPLRGGHDGTDLAERAADRVRPLFCIHEDEGVAVREGRWKLIVDLDTQMVSLYDLAEDPLETRSRAGDQREITSDLERRIFAFDVGRESHLSRAFGENALVREAARVTGEPGGKPGSLARRILAARR